MKTTLNIIKSHHPCPDGWAKLLKSLGKTKADDEPVSLEYILNSNGIQDAVWALRCFDYKEYCLFLSDVAESVLPIFEDKYPDDKRPRKCIEGIRLYHAGEIGLSELTQLSDAAHAAASAAARAAAHAAAYAAHAAAHAAAYAAHAARAAAHDAAYAAYAAYAVTWSNTERLFIKHFVAPYNREDEK